MRTNSGYRCRCGKLLFKGFLADGCIEIKCRRCGLLSQVAETNAAIRDLQGVPAGMHSGYLRVV